LLYCRAVNPAERYHLVLIGMLRCSYADTRADQRRSPAPVNEPPITPLRLNQRGGLTWDNGGSCMYQINRKAVADPGEIFALYNQSAYRGPAAKICSQ
jgi:hypothetical protein